MQNEGQSNRTLSIIIWLAVGLGALAGALFVLYRFRERLGLDRIYEKIKNVRGENKCNSGEPIVIEDVSDPAESVDA